LLRLGDVALFDVTLRDGRAVRLDDVPAANRSDEGNPWGTPPTTDIPLRSYLAIPVIRSSEVLGGLVLGHAAPGRFTERHERLLGGLAAQAAIAIDNARQYKVADEARRTAESANQAKDEFLAMLAHELRNPLGVVLNGVKILDRIGVRHGEAVRTRAVMARPTQHLARLLDDLLDDARIGRSSTSSSSSPSRRIARRPASGSAWRSSSAWSPSTAGACKPGARASVAAASSS